MDNQPQIQPPPDAFIEPMLKLRDHYGQQVEKFELLHRQALENLNHVEALLGAWSSSTDATSSITADEENLTQASSITISEPLVNTTQADILVNPDIAPDLIANSTTTQDDNITQLSLTLQQTNEPSGKQIQDLSITNTDIQQHTPIDEDETESSSLSYTEIPMIPEFQHLSRTEAIQQLLQQHVGTVCHIDFIVRSLYGDLKGNTLKVVKDRVYSTLSHGIESKKWFKVPSQPACYTLILSLIPSIKSADEKKVFNKNKFPLPQPSSLVVPMLEPYTGQFLIDALTSLFRENPGLIFNVAQVVEAIYGELNNEQLREVKPKVINELSRGYRTGRFSKVPGKIGLYTWDASLLQ